MPEKIPGALGAAAVFAEHRQPVVAHFQDREAVAADVDDGGRRIAEQELVTAQLSLFDGNAAEIDLGRKTSAACGSGKARPIPITQGFPQDWTGIFAVFENVCAFDAQAIRVALQFDQLHGFRADVNSHEARRRNAAVCRRCFRGKNQATVSVCLHNIMNVFIPGWPL